MEKKQSLPYLLGGAMLGILLTLTVCPCVSMSTSAEIRTGHDAENQDGFRLTGDNQNHDNFRTASEAGKQDGFRMAGNNQNQDDFHTDGETGNQNGFRLTGDNQNQDSSRTASETWDRTTVYTGGDTADYEGRLYRAKWWTLGELPGNSDVWEDLGVSDHTSAQTEITKNIPVNASAPQNRELTDFKVVGYYPSWKPDKLSCVDFGIVTHVCYAFAIPKTDGSLRDLENPDTAKALLRSAHDNGAKVLLSVGGWSYHDTPLESVFMEATATDAGIRRLAENILAMCEEYGFDGVDMDWEHPRTDGTSARQYEALMLTLADRLHKNGKLLTAAVLSGATPDGNIYYDAAAHTNTVLNAVDFINIMAYDGGDGERHSSYPFAVDCASYWKEARGLPSHKVVLGLPFYSRPGWADYGIILENAPDAWEKDHTLYNGMEVYYNGMDTVAKKTRYARENLGGVMIWELTQDTGQTDKSLLQTIGKNCRVP